MHFMLGSASALNKSRRAAFGLVEVLAALAIAAIAVTGWLTVAATAQKACAQSQTRQQASQAAQFVLAQWRAAPTAAQAAQSPEAARLPPLCADPARDEASATSGLFGQSPPVWLDAQGMRVAQREAAAYRLDYRSNYLAAWRAATVWCVLSWPPAETLHTASAAPSAREQHYECITRIEVAR